VSQCYEALLRIKLFCFAWFSVTYHQITLTRSHLEHLKISLRFDICKYDIPCLWVFKPANEPMHFFRDRQKCLHFWLFGVLPRILTGRSTTRKHAQYQYQPQYQQICSPHCSPYICYGTSWENWLTHQDIIFLVIFCLFLMTWSRSDTVRRKYWGLKG